MLFLRATIKFLTPGGGEREGEEGGAGAERDLETRSLAAKAVVRSSGPMVQ